MRAKAGPAEPNEANRRLVLVDLLAKEEVASSNLVFRSSEANQEMIAPLGYLTFPHIACVN